MLLFCFNLKRNVHAHISILKGKIFVYILLIHVYGWSDLNNLFDINGHTVIYLSVFDYAMA